MHLLIDGYGGRNETLADPEFLREFLDSFPSAIGMIKISTPSVVEYEAPTPEDSGISGFVIIAESHISVHTFPHRSYVNIDIFSCKTFDSDSVLTDIKAHFQLHKVNSWVVARGLENYDPQLAIPRLAEARFSNARDH